MKEELKKEGIEWAKAFAMGIIIFAFIRTFFFSNYVVEGESMFPTLEEGNKLVVNKIAYDARDLKRFDIIVFHANEKEDFVKRIIGLPGDEIEYKNNTLYVNGNKVKEPFLKKDEAILSHITGDFALIELTGAKQVPKDMLFVLGDNRLGSWDSRHFGFIAIDQVVGKVNLRYWPIDKLELTF